MFDPHRTGTRLSWSLALGVVRLTYDGRPVQQGQVQFTGDRLVPNTSLMQHFGFASRPPVGSKVVGVFLEGDPVNGIGIASNHQASRPTDLAEGDAKMHDVRGAYVWLSADGLQIEAKGLPVTVGGATHVTVVASEKVRLDAPLVEITGGATVAHGATGVFTSKEGRVVTVAAGITTKIV